MASKRVHSGSESILNYFSKKAKDMGKTQVSQSVTDREAHVPTSDGCINDSAHPNQIVAETSSTVICSSSLTSAFLPDSFSSANFSETRTKAQGLLHSMKDPKILVASIVTKNVLEIIKPIAVKLQKEDEDIVHAYNLIHSVISDIAIFRENIEKDFHDWFMDASRIGSELGIVLTVPRLSGRQQHRANAGPENPDPEVYYRINVAIPFLDHME